jgi:hypothetical protein
MMHGQQNIKYLFQSSQQLLTCLQPWPKLLVAYRGHINDSPWWPPDQSLLRCPAALFNEFWRRRHVAAPRARNTARLCRRFWLRCCCDTWLQSPEGTRPSLPCTLNSPCLSTYLRVFFCVFFPLSFSVSQNGQENNLIVCLSLDSSIQKSNKRARRSFQYCKMSQTPDALFIAAFGSGTQKQRQSDSQKTVKCFTTTI